MSAPPPATPTEQALHADVARLSAIDRLPCSPGEAEAAAWIAARFAEAGARVTVDEEDVHGTYYTPLGVLNGLAAAGGLAVLAGRRGLGAIAGAVAVAGLWQDLTGAPRRTLRRFLRRGITTNVIAEFGPADAQHTVVVHAHHDAARTSFIFDDTATRFVVEKLPWVMEGRDRWPPLMGLVVGGPAGVAVSALTGGRRTAALATAFALGTAVVMADMVRQPVVPGANDNLSGVATSMSLAKALAADPPQNTRVIFLFPGSEEGFQEGMRAWFLRHRDELPKDSTLFINHETVGSPHLALLEGEGMLGITDYPEDFKDFIQATADDLGIFLWRELRTRNASDSLIPLRAGYKCALFVSCDELKAPTNYHWYTDTAANVNYETVADMARLALELTRRLDW
jgi:hypothetical protein